jgi:glycosyltransferase involved in cell wall biosynthesis
MEFSLERYKQITESNNQEVTVFMLTHNREHYLELAVKSLLKQTYTNYCLVVLDNCSEDNTKEVINNIKDERVMYLYRESKAGDSNTEFARDICATKYFIILHDDDILSEKYLDTVVKAMNDNDYAALSVRYSIIDKDGNLTERCVCNGGSWEFRGDSYFKSFLKSEGASFLYPSVIYRTSFYKDFPDFGGNPEVGPAGDQFIWFETCRMGGTICLLDEDLFCYRMHRGQESSVNNGSMILQLFDYLIKDDYYRSVIDSNPKYYEKRMWTANKRILLQYSRGKFTSEQYKELLHSPSIEYMANYSEGRLMNKAYYMIYRCRRPLSVIIRRVKGGR